MAWLALPHHGAELQGGGKRSCRMAAHTEGVAWGAGDLRKLTELKGKFICDNPSPQWEATWQPVDTIKEGECAFLNPKP